MKILLFPFVLTNILEDHLLRFIIIFNFCFLLYLF